MLIDAEQSDLFDVLEYIAFKIEPISRATRVKAAKSYLITTLDKQQNEFLDFVLSKYIETGVEELDQEKLPQLLTLKYKSIADATTILGGIAQIRDNFISFQQYLYA